MSNRRSRSRSPERVHIHEENSIPKSSQYLLGLEEAKSDNFISKIDQLLNDHKAQNRIVKLEEYKSLSGPTQILKYVQEEVLPIIVEIGRGDELKNEIQPNVAKLNIILSSLNLLFGEYLARVEESFYATHVNSTPDIVNGFITFIYKLLNSLAIMEKLKVCAKKCILDLIYINLQDRLNFLASYPIELQLYKIENYFEFSQLSPRTVRESLLNTNSRSCQEVKYNKIDDQADFRALLNYPLFKDSLVKLKPQGKDYADIIEFYLNKIYLIDGMGAEDCGKTLLNKSIAIKDFYTTSNEIKKAAIFITFYRELAHCFLRDDDMTYKEVNIDRSFARFSDHATKSGKKIEIEAFGFIVDKINEYSASYLLNYTPAISPEQFREEFRSLNQKDSIEALGLRTRGFNDESEIYLGLNKCAFRVGKSSNYNRK